jgi:hypothetical protein
VVGVIFKKSKTDEYERGFDAAIGLLGDDLTLGLDALLDRTKKKGHRRALIRAQRVVFDVLDFYEFRTVHARDFAQHRPSAQWTATSSWSDGTNSSTKEWSSHD